MIYINDIKFIPEYFPDETFRLNYECLDSAINIKWLFEKNEELVELYFLVKHLREIYKINNISLYLPYIPNARMDRIKNNHEVFTLKYFAEFINSLNFMKVVVRDAHSDVSLKLINNIEQESISDKINKLTNTLLINENDLLYFPDKGACKRYIEYVNRKYIFGEKERKWETGEIVGLNIIGDIPTSKFNVLMIDDICSYGGTFYHSAKKLKEIGADKIWIYVTHCENSVLEGELINSGLIEKIFTTESIFTKKHQLIEII